MVTTTLIPTQSQPLSLEDWLQNPPERTEWVNGEIRDKKGMTLKHSKVQARLSSDWSIYKDANQQVSCCASKLPIGFPLLPLAFCLLPDLNK